MLFKWINSLDMDESSVFSVSYFGSTYPDQPHEGEEFGYVLSGTITIVIGNRSMKAKKGEAFYYTANSEHYIKAGGKSGRSPRCERRSAHRRHR